jgi:PhoPQ-activated pathogenicity-related protein
VKTTSDELLNVYVWVADSDDRDFRDEEFISEKISSSNTEEIKYKITFPKTGFKAFYIDLEYTDPNGGKYTKSTRMFLADNDEVL